MNKREIGSLAFKLMGIYLFVLTVPLVTQAFFMFIYPFTSGRGQGAFDSIAMPCLSLISALVMILGGRYLIRRSDAMAARLFPGEAAQQPLTRTSMGDVQLVAYSVVGLALAAQALPGIATHGLNLLFLLHNSSYSMQPDFMRNLLIPLVREGAQFALGLWLFYHGESVMNLWRKARTGDTYRRVEEEGEAEEPSRPAAPQAPPSPSTPQAPKAPLTPPKPGMGDSGISEDE